MNCHFFFTEEQPILPMHVKLELCAWLSHILKDLSIPTGMSSIMMPCPQRKETNADSITEPSLCLINTIRIWALTQERGQVQS